MIKLEAAKLLGWDKIAAVSYDVDNKKAIAFAIADNRTMELGYTEADLLSEFILEIHEEYPELVDSLGWAMYLAGDYSGAVTYLEKAVELEPGDPTLNDHLGDAYWKIGRKNEARFQWRHALTMKPEDKEKTKIQAKIEQGLARN